LTSVKESDPAIHYTCPREEECVSEYPTGNGGQSGPEKAARLKAIIDALADGAAPAAVKREFRDLIEGADASEVAALEQSLIDGGVPVEEVQRLCEVHADVFRSGLERGERPDRMPGHPVHTYLAENREAGKRARSLFLASLGGLEAIRRAAAELRPVIVHYERKENQLFPFLERTGFTGPSKVMWGKHDEIRSAFKALDEAIAAGRRGDAGRAARGLARRVNTMIFMEERILFPNALKRLGEADWAAVRRGEDAIGFAWVKPGAAWDPALAGPAPGAPGSAFAKFVEAAPAPAAALDGSTEIPLSTGSLPLDWLDRVLTKLPIDISFVDAEDKVRYYSDSPHRVFPRSPGVIGRAVQNCHPPKSVAIVEKILEAFKKKEKDKADFWLEVNGRFILISYQAIYGARGEYLGTLEMSMDATEIRGLQGQRRLLDW
jgi:uncharacterized protein